MIDVGAIRMAIGSACGVVGRAASLSVDRVPLLGTRVELQVRSSAGQLAVVLIGPERAVAMPFQVAGACLLHVDPSVAAMLPALGLVSGRAQLGLDIPSLVAIENLQLTAQAVIGATDAPLDIDFSNGVMLRLGR